MKKPTPTYVTEAKDVTTDKWLDFLVSERKARTIVYNVRSKCDETMLGQIRWYGPWRHYCFFPTTYAEIVHSDRCLLTISKFITELNTKHKGGA